MRFPLLVPCVCFACLALPSPLAVGKTAREPLSYSERVRLFLNATDSPVLFVGRILKVNSNPLPCTVASVRDTTWSVSKVLFGFDPGKHIDVGFPSCGAAEAQFSSQDEMLVLAYPGYQNLWTGMKQSVVPATDANLLLASKATDNYLRRSVRELVRPARGRGGHSRPVLAFEGTVVAPGCWFPPGPDYSTGDHLLVFAIVVNGGELIGRLLAPADQIAEAKAALDAVSRR
jgi:hypothetical protein